MKRKSNAKIIIFYVALIAIIFIAVFAITLMGIVFGGLAGYFGGWVDNVIMRICDVLMCLPGFPILLIIGVNGTSAGIRITAPYACPISYLLKKGDNTVTIVVANTLAGKVRDGFSHNMPIAPSGLLGPIRLLEYN